MFRKLGQASALAWEASADGVAVGYTESALARIARVHQFGLRDRVTRQADSPEAQYPARRLLGLTADDRRRILEIILSEF